MRNESKKLVITEEKNKKLTKRKYSSPIEYMYNKNSLTLSQFSTANELNSYYNIAWLRPIDYTPKERIQVGVRKLEHSERMVAAQQKYDKAIKTLTSSEKEVIEKVVIMEDFISQHYKHWYTAKKAKKLLQLALNKIEKIFN